MAARIILVGNEKGGCGKTTISVNLAAKLALDGRDVLLVAADPQQQSASKWAGRRKDAQPTPARLDCVTLIGKNIRSEIQSLAQRYDSIIIDTGAEDSHELRSAVCDAHHLIIPLKPEAFDVWTLPTMVDIVTRARPLNEGLQVTIAVNMVQASSAEQVEDDVRGLFAENLPEFAYQHMTRIVGRVAFGKASIRGLSVFELPSRERDPKAIAELTSLYDLVTA